MYLMPRLKKLGRVGSAAVLVISVLVFAGGLWLLPQVWPLNGAELWSPQGTALSCLCIFMAPIVGLQALVTLWRNAPPVRKTDAELASLLAEGRPLIICLDCRTEITVPPCEHCGQSSTCFDVRTSADVENARLFLELK